MVELRDIRETAAPQTFRAHDGEQAWRRSSLPRAMQDLVERRYAITGGEVWVVEGSFSCSLSPSKEGGWTVIAWHVSPREPGESWAHFAMRSFEETLAAICRLNPEDRVSPEVADKLYYHVFYAAESDYCLAGTGHVSRETEDT